jgi:hypothetical protein
VSISSYLHLIIEYNPKAETSEANLQTKTIKQLIQWLVSVPNEPIALETLQISSILSTLFLNRMVIQKSSWIIKKNIWKKDYTNVALVDEVRN